MLRVATHASDEISVVLDDDTTADAAVGAGAPRFTHDSKVGAGDTALVQAQEDAAIVELHGKALGAAFIRRYGIAVGQA